MAKSKTVIQEHHISYQPPETVKVYKGEHWILSQLQRRKKFSNGFFTALDVFISLNRGKGERLE